jgi:hypothetical protein
MSLRILPFFNIDDETEAAFELDGRTFTWSKMPDGRWWVHESAMPLAVVDATGTSWEVTSAEGPPGRKSHGNLQDALRDATSR